MRDTATPHSSPPGSHVNRSPQPASPAVNNMDESLNNTKDSQRKFETDESILGSSFSSSDNLQSTISAHDSDGEPMDISNKTTTTIDSDNNSDCSSPSNPTKFFCPICDITLTSQHEFTLHIRSHNNDNEINPEKGFTCRICSKVLSSSSSLDRHVLVHSGERPFRCKICFVTFTTNGNMHRHMRTHSQKSGENYESDASTDSNASVSSNGKSRKRRLEFNNNKLVDNSNKRKSDCFNNDEDNYMHRRKSKNFNNNNNINETNIQKYLCPVCDREDFASLNVLETHLETNHPDYEVKCISCNLSFKNHRALNLHRDMVHHTEKQNNIANRNIRNAHIGFKDLTFVDFSSNKFPHIARYECEKNLHKSVTGQKFICEKCSRAFPCSSALEMHQDECLKNKVFNYPTDLSQRTNDEEIQRENFFARLDLQNKSGSASPDSPAVTCEESKTVNTPVVKSAIDSKDLADIQSILSMTSNGSLLQHLRTKPPSELMPSNPDNLRTPEQHHEEETQDAFAAEFRKMKLRGEFPCRLCTAIFPNLRALKGHNRAHLTGNGNSGPYRCNMCPHSSVDKAALIRHMRTHNGDRPYECSLCNYAFTTKANCERHLRNRHAKVTREDVKKSIIYHPSEDPTNDETNKINSSRNDIKHSLLNNSNDEDLHATEGISASISTAEHNNIIIPGIKIPTTLISKGLSINRQINPDHFNKDIAIIKEKIVVKDHKADFPYSDKLELNYSLELPDKVKEDLIHSKIQVKKLDELKQIPDYESEEEESTSMSSNFDHYPKSSAEHPIDLSMDVLDLSKKKESPVENDEPQDFRKRTLESTPIIPPPPTPAQLLLAQQLLKHPYMNHLSQFYQNPTLFPNLPNLQSNLFPFLFPPPFLNPQAQEMKERMLRLQLSGGTMISEQFSSVRPNGMQSYPQELPNIPEIKYPVAKADSQKSPLHINIQLADNISKLQSPKSQQKTPEMIHSPNSVKMVIKNGVLMPKQKQRRYRTERPFSCEHCSARFTLRSNMERHIKQQHPQFWSQRQRAGISGVGRKPITASATNTQSNPKPPFYDLNIPNYDMSIPKMQDPVVTEAKDKEINVAQHHMSISQHVKYALLAQQLKARNVENNAPFTKDRPPNDDDEDALVIDEENVEEKLQKHETKETIIEVKNTENDRKSRLINEKIIELCQIREKEIKMNEKLQINMAETNLLKLSKSDEAGQDLVPVSRLLDNAVSTQLPFREYFRRDGEDNEGVSEEDEEGLVASGSTSEGNGSGSDENKSENETAPTTEPGKKRSAYSLAPNRVSCPYCHRKFPWTSSLRRHVLTHTGQKPFKCSQCPLLFTTKSNCDRHLLRKHGNTGNSNLDSSNNNNNNSQNYMMRNVPERPYKCSSCPSSTFSTLSNLKKHMSCKHTIISSDADSIKGEEIRPPSRNYENMTSSEDERISKPTSDTKSDWENQISHSKIPIPSLDQTNAVQNADLPFKCHLCEGSYAERQDALDHIRDNHISEYELLMSKGALDASTSGHDEAHSTNHDPEDDEHLRGKFPDYANRKVMCAFCMRRFWSAEDLRRHMRTHTGERPFSCDVCSRRFTLKHSMLRHRKKHNLTTNLSEDGVLASGDEEANSTQVVYEKFAKLNNNNNLGPVNAARDKSAEKSSGEDSEGTEGNDLIGNLLGIRDRSIIDQVLVSSADDAAKLLGVNNGQE